MYEINKIKAKENLTKDEKTLINRIEMLETAYDVQSKLYKELTKDYVDLKKKVANGGRNT